MLPLWADGDMKRDGCMSEMEADRVACNDLGMRTIKRQTEKSSRITSKLQRWEGFISPGYDNTEYRFTDVCTVYYKENY